MDINKIQLEHDIYKKNVKKFSILTGVFIILSIVSVFSLVFLSVIFPFIIEMISQSKIDFPIEILVIFYFFLFLICEIIISIFAILSEVFIPFIVINAVKLGNRNKHLNRYFAQQKSVKEKELEIKESQNDHTSSFDV